MKIMHKAFLKKRRLVSRFKYTNNFQNVKREIAIMKKCHHPNVVKLFEVIDGQDDDCLYLGEWRERERRERERERDCNNEELCRSEII